MLRGGNKNNMWKRNCGYLKRARWRERLQQSCRNRNVFKYKRQRATWSKTNASYDKGHNV